MAVDTRFTNTPIASAFGFGVASPISDVRLARDQALIFSLRPDHLVRWHQPSTRSLFAASGDKIAAHSVMTYDANDDVIYLSGRGFDAENGEVVYDSGEGINAVQISVDSVGNRVMLISGATKTLKSLAPDDTENWSISITNYYDGMRFAIDSNDDIIITGYNTTLGSTKQARKISGVDGSEIWEMFKSGPAIRGISMDVSISGSLLVLAGYFFTSATNPFGYATVLTLNASTGEMIDNADPTGTMGTGSEAVASRIITDGTTVGVGFPAYTRPPTVATAASPATATNRGLYSLDNSLATVWNNASIEPRSLAIEQFGLIVAGLTTPSVRRFDAAGATEWSYDCGKPATSLACAPSDDRLWIGLNNDSGQGSLFWPRTA